MKFESRLIVSTLLALEQQLVELRRHAEELAATFGRGRLGPAVAATGNLRRGFDLLAVAITSLKPHVIAFDGEALGDTVGSLGELALRAATMVAVVQLGRLTEAIPRAAGHANTHAWFAGRFHGIDEVARFIRDELDRIHGSWTPYRCDERAAPPGGEGLVGEQRRTRYRHAVREAQRALIALGRDPGVAHFLREGAACADWPEVHTACTEIAAVLNLQLDAEPDRRLFEVPPAPVRPRDSSPTTEP